MAGIGNPKTLQINAVTSSVVEEPEEAGAGIVPGCRRISGGRTKGVGESEPPKKNALKKGVGSLPESSRRDKDRLGNRDGAITRRAKEKDRIRGPCPGTGQKQSRTPGANEETRKIIKKKIPRTKGGGQG